MLVPFPGISREGKGGGDDVYQLGADKGRRGMTSETLRLPPNLYMTEKDGKRWCGDLGHLTHVPSTLCYVASISNPKLTKKIMFEM